MVGGLQGENGDLDIKKSKEEYLTMSVATIGKLRENTRALCKMAAKSFRSKMVISQPCKNLPSAWSDLLAMTDHAPFKALDC